MRMGMGTEMNFMGMGLKLIWCDVVGRGNPYGDGVGIVLMSIAMSLFTVTLIWLFISEIFLVCGLRKSMGAL